MSMEEERLTRKGELAETPEGKKVLINEKGDAYAVSEAIIIVWANFENNTVREVAEKLAVASNRNPDEFQEPVNEIARALRAAELLMP